MNEQPHTDFQPQSLAFGTVAGAPTAMRVRHYAPVARRKMDPLRITLFAFVVLTISRVHQHFTFLNAGRPALILFLGIVGFALMKPSLLAPRRMLATWPARVVAGLGVVASLSVFFGISLGSSAHMVIDEYSRTLILAFVLFAVLGTAWDVRVFVWAYLVAAAIWVWMANFVFMPSRGNSYVTRLQSLYTFDSNDLGCVLVVALPLALLAFQTSRGWRKAFAACLVAGLGETIAKTGSRGAFVGLLAVGVALLFVADRVSIVKRVAFVAGVGLALIVAAPEGYWDQMSTLANPKADYNWNTVDGRRQIAMRGMGYMLRYPLFGVGIGNFGKAEMQLSDKMKLYQEGKLSGIRIVAPHNSFVEVGAELGLTGLVLWSSLVLGGAVGMLKLRRRLPKAWSRGTRDQRFLYAATGYLALALVGFSISSFFVSFAYMDVVYILAALMSGVYAAVRRETPAPASALGVA